MQIRDRGTQDIFENKDTHKARERLNPDLYPEARRKLDELAVAHNLEDLHNPPGNRLEELHGERAGQYSIRINHQYRICFRWERGEAVDVEIVDYH